MTSPILSIIYRSPRHANARTYNDDGDCFVSFATKKYKEITRSKEKGYFSDYIPKDWFSIEANSTTFSYSSGDRSLKK